jgi:hypothetical protein
MDPRFGAKRANELAARQFGAIARRQLLELGFSTTRIRDWLRCGRLYRRYPGVYALGRPDLSPDGQLAAGLLFAGHGAALAGLTCLWWLDLLNRRPSLIHIDAPGKKRSRQDLRIRHPRSIERSVHRGLPVVPLPRALLASAEALSLNSLRLVLARAEFHHLLSLPSIESALGEGRRGSRALRAALDAHLPQLALCANGLERDLVLLCERFGLPLPEPNQRIGRYRPDMLWREARLIVELDGKDAHRTPAQLIADADRQAYLERRGFRVIRFSWAEVEFEAVSVAAQVRSHLASR